MYPQMVYFSSYLHVFPCITSFDPQDSLRIKCGRCCYHFCSGQEKHPAANLSYLFGSSDFTSSLYFYWSTIILIMLSLLWPHCIAYIFVSPLNPFQNKQGINTWILQMRTETQRSWGALGQKLVRHLHPTILSLS